MRKFFLFLHLLAPLVFLGGSGCSTPSKTAYLWHAFRGQMAMMNRQRSLEEAAKDHHIPTKYRNMIERVPALMGFVRKLFSFPLGDHFKTYVHLDRPMAVYVLTVAPPFELKSYEWCFPLVGCVPYLGFFDMGTAQKWKLHFEQSGYDTFLRGAAAYSTLGYFTEPLVSSMLEGDPASVEESLVNTMAHESTHRRLWIAGGTDINEAFAQVIGDYAECSYAAKKGDGSRKLCLERQRWEQALGGLMAAEVKGWSSFWNSEKVRAAAEVQKLEWKEQNFQRLKRKLEAMTTEWGKGSSLSGEERAGFLSRMLRLNNHAAVLGFLHYQTHYQVFEKWLHRCGGDVSKTISSVERAIQEAKGSDGDKQEGDQNNHFQGEGFWERRLQLLQPGC